MVNISFSLADDPSCPTEIWSAKLTTDKIKELTKLYLDRNKRGANIKLIVVGRPGNLFKLCDIRDEWLAQLEKCTVILYINEITLYFTSGSDKYSGASPYLINPTLEDITNTANGYLTKYKIGSVVKAIKLKNPNGLAYSLDKISAAVLRGCNNFTVIVYSE